MQYNEVARLLSVQVASHPGAPYLTAPVRLHCAGKGWFEFPSNRVQVRAVVLGPVLLCALVKASSLGTA
jgi:hypothetical protein